MNKYNLVLDTEYKPDTECEVDFTKCNNEQQFKKLFCKTYWNGIHVFFIETEETCAGFPDVLLFSANKIGMVTGGLVEFKFADKSGAITFKPTQPAFYKKYADLDVTVVAYNKRSNTIHSFAANRIFDESDPYFTNGKARINLSKVEARLK